MTHVTEARVGAFGFANTSFHSKWFKKVLPNAPTFTEGRGLMSLLKVMPNAAYIMWYLAFGIGKTNLEIGFGQAFDYLHFPSNGDETNLLGRKEPASKELVKW